MLLFWVFLDAPVAGVIFLHLEALRVGDCWGSSSESGSGVGLRDIWTLLGAGVSPLFASWGRFRARRAAVLGSASILSWGLTGVFVSSLCVLCPWLCGRLDVGEYLWCLNETPRFERFRLVRLPFTYVCYLKSYAFRVGAVVPLAVGV